MLCQDHAYVPSSLLRALPQWAPTGCRHGPKPVHIKVKVKDAEGPYPHNVTIEVVPALAS